MPSPIPHSDDPTIRARATEPWPTIWTRRAVTIPLYLALAAIATLGAPLLVTVALATDAATGSPRRLPRTRALAFFGMYLWCEVVGIAVATFLWATTLGGRIGGPTRYLDLNAALQRWWTNTLFRGAVSIFAMRVEVEGTEVARTGPFLLFVRHSSTADTMLAAALVANPNRLLLRYVLKRELFWDPCIDIVGRRLPNAFIDRRSPRREGEVAAIRQLADDLDARSAALIYPEGTRFEPAKLQAGVQALRDRGNEALAKIAATYTAVLPPRLAGPLGLLDAAPGLDVVILEHTGFEGATTFAEFWSGALVGTTLRARLRRIPAAEIPETERDVWLFRTWAETDRWTREATAATRATP